MTLPIAFLLMCANFVYLHGNPTIPGVNHNLCCVNDYLFTVYCSLAVTPTHASLDGYSLIFKRLFLPSAEEKYVCQLRKTDGHYDCSFNTTNDDGLDDEYEYDYPETFSEMHFFEITLCQIRRNGSENCEVLDDKYKPAKNIKPKAPCCLIWDTSQDLFSWRSGYEEEFLIKKLMYQLHFFNRDRNVTVETHSTSFSVNDSNLWPDTEYTVKVRSIPRHDDVSHGGQWSEWSAGVSWKTQPALTRHVISHSQPDPSANTIISHLDKRVIISLCVLAPLLLFLCFAPVIKARLCSFIPTPAPYFQSLYSECQGDFKSWVVTPSNDTGLLKAEETLRIDTLTKHAEEEEDSAPQTHRKTLQEGLYCNMMTLPDSDAALLVLPYAVSPAPPPSPPPQTKPEGVVVERDSGCSACSATSLDAVDRDACWSTGNYCTLTDTLWAFQTPCARMVEQRQVCMDTANHQNQYVSMTGFISAPAV